MTRLFVNEPITLSSVFILKDEPFNHAIRVLRKNTGDELTLFNGQGGEYYGRIIDVQKKHASIEIFEFKKINRESALRIHLYQSLAKGDKLDLIIQKATELGVDEITLLSTQRSIMNLKTDRIDKKMGHFQSIIISACEQSGRNQLPKLHLPIKLSDIPLSHQPNGNPDSKLLISLSPYALQNLSGLIKTFQQNSTNRISEIGIIIGPEGGLNSEELQLLEDKGCMAVQLGTRILRTETAGIAVISALHALLGDW